MALKAEIRLSDREKMFRFVVAVNEMAADAAYIAAAVCRTLKDGVLAGVAVETQIIHLFRSSIRRIEDL